MNSEHTYLIRVASNLSAAVHAPTCRVVANRTARDGVHVVTGATAAAVAAEFDADNDQIARGLRPTKVCACCRGA